MTQLMRDVLYLVRCTNDAGRWHRATSSGQRVTLAALHRNGRLERRVWRHAKRVQNSAHEYAVPTFAKSQR
jgi:hypothetical protein